MLIKTFRIITFRDGEQYPSMHIYPKKYEMLYELGMNQLSKSIGVKIVIENLEKIKSGELREYELSTGDWCVVNVKKDTSIITNNFDEFEPVEISTSEIVQLMEEWYEFLLDYENGEIPNIIPHTKRDEWMVVRRSDMKEIKWDKDS